MGYRNREVSANGFGISQCCGVLIYQLLQYLEMCLLERFGFQSADKYFRAGRFESKLEGEVGQERV